MVTVSHEAGPTYNVKNPLVDRKFGENLSKCLTYLFLAGMSNFNVIHIGLILIRLRTNFKQVFFFSLK